MVSKIIACADLHIRNLRRIEEYQEQFSKFIEDCRKTAEEEKGGVAIVIAGDIFHNKLDISAEGYALAAWFFRQLDDIAPTFVIAGNHDMSRNLERLDPLSMLFSVSPFKNMHYLDKELGYQSDCFVYENITFALYSAFDNFTRPNIEEYKISNPENKIVGLFHGGINGGKSDAGYICDNGFIKPKQIAALRKYLEQGTVTQSLMISIMNNSIPVKAPVRKITLNEKKLTRYFPQDYTTEDMEKVIESLLEKWKQEQEEV